VIGEAGYVYVYLSNDNYEMNHQDVEVYFDDFMVEHVKSPVIQSEDFYPFGLTFNSYSRENSLANPFKFNGIEEQDELGLNVLQAAFRTNDPTTGRWWQIDPKAVEWESPYSAMGNNPILNSDPLGDTTSVYSMKGELMSTINDSHANQVHFVKSALDRNEDESDDDYATRVRAGSTAFMGANTASDMQMISGMSNALGVEIGFLGSIGEDREIRLGALPPDGSNKVDEISIVGFKDQMSKADRGDKATSDFMDNVFMAGHTHPDKAIKKYPGESEDNKDKRLSTPSGYISGSGKTDYYPILGGGTPGMVLTGKSFSLYPANGVATDFQRHKVKSLRSK